MKRGATGTSVFSSGTVCFVVYFPSLRRSGYENKFPLFSTDKERILWGGGAEVTNICEEIVRKMYVSNRNHVGS